MTEPDKAREAAPRNHWNADGDLIIERKTMFRQVGWLGQSGTWYPMGFNMGQSLAGFSPVFTQIATWTEGEGWDD